MTAALCPQDAIFTPLAATLGSVAHEIHQQYDRLVDVAYMPALIEKASAVTPT